MEPFVEPLPPYAGRLYRFLSIMPEAPQDIGTRREYCDRDPLVL